MTSALLNIAPRRFRAPRVAVECHDGTGQALRSVGNLGRNHWHSARVRPRVIFHLLTSAVRLNIYGICGFSGAR